MQTNSQLHAQRSPRGGVGNRPPQFMCLLVRERAVVFTGIQMKVGLLNS